MGLSRALFDIYNVWPGLLVCLLNYQFTSIAFQSFKSLFTVCPIWENRLSTSLFVLVSLAPFLSVFLSLTLSNACFPNRIVPASP